MANKDFPSGLWPHKMSTGGKIPMNAYEAGVTTAIYEGDVVQLKAGGRVKTMTTVTGVDTILGVAATYVKASASAHTTVWVYDDPNTYFVVNSDGTTDPTNLTTAINHIGAGADMILTTGNTTTQRSKQEIDYSQITTATGSAALKVMGYDESADNDKTLAHANFLVRFQRHINTDKGHVI